MQHAPVYSAKYSNLPAYFCVFQDPDFQSLINASTVDYYTQDRDGRYALTTLRTNTQCHTCRQCLCIAHYILARGAL